MQTFFGQVAEKVCNVKISNNDKAREGEKNLCVHLDWIFDGQKESSH